MAEARVTVRIRFSLTLRAALFMSERVWMPRTLKLWLIALCIYLVHTPGHVKVRPRG